MLAALLTILFFISSAWAQTCTTKTFVIDDFSSEPRNNRKVARGWSGNLNVERDAGNYTLQPTTSDTNPHYFFTRLNGDYSQSTLDGRNLPGLKLRIDYSVQRVSGTFSFVVGIAYGSSLSSPKVGTVYFAVKVASSGARSTYLDLSRLSTTQLEFMQGVIVGNIKGQGILSLHSIKLLQCGPVLRYSKTPLFPLIGIWPYIDEATGFFPLCRGISSDGNSFPGYTVNWSWKNYCHVIRDGKGEWIPNYQMMDTNHKVEWQSQKGANSISEDGKYFCQAKLAGVGGTGLFAGLVVNGECHFNGWNRLYVEPEFKYLNIIS